MKKAITIVLSLILTLSLSACSGNKAEEKPKESVSAEEEVIQEEVESDIPEEPTETIKTDYGVIDKGYTFTMWPLQCYDIRTDNYREVNYTFRTADECKKDSFDYGDWLSGNIGNLGGSTYLSRFWPYQQYTEIPILVFTLVPEDDYDRGKTPLATTLEEAEKALYPQIADIKKYYKLDFYEVDNFYTVLNRETITTQNGIEMLKVTGRIENPNTVNWDHYEEYLRFIEFTAYYFLDEDYPVGVFAVPTKMNEEPYKDTNEMRGMCKFDGFEEHVNKFIQNITKGIQKNEELEAIEMPEPEKEQEEVIEIKADDKYNSGAHPIPPNSPTYTMPKELYTYHLLDKKIIIGETKYGEISSLVTPVTKVTELTEWEDGAEDAFYVKVNNTKAEIKLVLQIDDVKSASSIDDAVIVGISIKEPEKVKDVISTAYDLSSTDINDVLEEIGLTKNDIFINLTIPNDSHVDTLWIINYCDMKLTGINPKAGEGTLVTLISCDKDGISYIKSYEMEAFGNYKTSIASRL